MICSLRRTGCRHLLAALAAACLVTAPPAAADPDFDDMAARAATVELTQRAFTHIREVGRERALADFNRADGGFVQGEAYVFCHDAGSRVLAHGGNPRLVGRDMSDTVDPDGRRPGHELTRIGLSEGEGWFEFRWPNPVTKRIQRRVAYIRKVDDATVCGSGYFR
ncbi:cache domain-containing protein [Paracraurococcus lichenis]|uniref:Cache domain-containing protein n=1 Tax=Paracraurococcus lichenis TaxID=3064888 RepID=A0ABT9ED85_9PROT|nr:cache domain-containing protein [Paracraurococcus sp. LOR1-02]MDO9714182.1 cache domain-containing protein [Paracraurococcus sp. LOR1-02]